MHDKRIDQVIFMGTRAAWLLQSAFSNCILYTTW